MMADYSRREYLRVARWPISLFVFSFMVAKYMFLRSKGLKLKTFKTYFISISILYNCNYKRKCKMFWLCYSYMYIRYNFISFIKKVTGIPLEIFVWWFSMKYIFSEGGDFLRIISTALFSFSLFDHFWLQVST